VTAHAEVLVRSLPVQPDPLALYAALSANGTRTDTLLLESGDTTARHGERSLIVAGAALRIACRGREVEVRALSSNGAALLPWLAESLTGIASEVAADGADGLVARFQPPPGGEDEARLKAPSPMDVLRALTRYLPVSGPEGYGPIIAGVFGYDLIGVFERLPESASDPLGWPDFEMVLADRMVWVHHRHARATVVAVAFGAGETARAAAAVAELSDEVARRPARARPVRTGRPAPEATARAEGASVRADLCDAEYAALVERLKGHIVAGDVFQIVPSRTFSLPCPAPLAAYGALRDLNPSPYMFYLAASSGVLFGASPETAVRVGSDRRVEIRPIAGTRRRGPDPDTDGRIEAELRTHPKEVAEHMMLVDLARNDVARVCVPGTRRLDSLLAVERYSHVMHLVSTVSGELRPDLDALAALVASLPMGTLTGAPKIEAARLLRVHERTRRGPYGGAVGYLAADGRMDTGIVIRSAVVRDGTAGVRAGAGVVFDSDPEAEADETRRKANAVLAAIAEAGGGTP